MTPAPIRIAAIVSDHEYAAVTAAAAQLAECIGEPVSLTDPSAVHDMLVLSLTDALESGDPVGDIEARMRQHIERSGAQWVLLLTLFRHRPDRHKRPETIARLRALNLIALALSHETGCAIVDIDRLFALFGARAVQCDYRLQGPIAAEVAGHGIVTALFACGLDFRLPPETLTKARELHGDFAAIAPMVERRLKGRMR